MKKRVYYNLIGVTLFTELGVSDAELHYYVFEKRHVMNNCKFSKYNFQDKEK